MDDAEFEVQKARVERLIERWVKPIGLGWWRIMFTWERGFKPEDEPNWHTHFVVQADWRYLDAMVTAYLPAIEALDDTGLEKSFLHELMHIFLNELRGTGMTKEHQAREERVATVLANAFRWMAEEFACTQPHLGDGAVVAVA